MPPPGQIWSKRAYNNKSLSKISLSEGLMKENNDSFIHILVLNNYNIKKLPLIRWSNLLRRSFYPRCPAGKAGWEITGWYTRPKCFNLDYHSDLACYYFFLLFPEELVVCVLNHTFLPFLETSSNVRLVGSRNDRVSWAPNLERLAWQIELGQAKPVIEKYITLIIS